jgi:HEAT repeat protein/beta-lactamase regulating signal transducer with metallopeptidase domain
MIDVLIKTTVLLALVALAAHLLRRNSASLRHLVWSFAIIALVALPVMTALLPYRLRVLPTDVASQVTARASTDLTNPSMDEAGKAKDSEAAPGVAGDPGASSASAPVAASSRFRLPGTRALLLIVWAAGALALLSRFAMGFVRVRRIARRAPEVTDEVWLSLADRAGAALDLRSPVTLRRSEQVAMPFACGLTDPVIVLPASADEWSQQRREAVLMHEFAHISRGDLAMNAMTHVARALYWFHPLVWLAAYRVRVEGERACDDAVLRAGALPSDYAEHLLSIVRQVGNTVPNVALAMARRSDFEGRLLAILEPGVPRGKLTRLRAAGLAALFLATVMPLAAMAPASPGVKENQTNMATELATQEPPVTPAAPVKPATPADEEEKGRKQGLPENTSAVNALVETLTDANPAVRLAAAQSLGSLEDPRAIVALAKALKEDADARVREAAANSLGEIDDNRAVPHLIEALRAEKVGAVKVQIVEALSEIDDPSAVAAVATVVRDPSVAVRRAAVSALGELEDPSAVTALISAARDEDMEVRQGVASALGSIENPAGMETLTMLTRDAHHDVRKEAISSLAHFEDSRTLGAFVAALKDEHPDVRAQAADAIHNIDGITKAPAELIDLLRDTNREVRKQAAHALGSIGDEAAVPGLKRAVSDSDTEVRRTAVESLKEIGGAEAMTALLALLKDSDPEVRRIAAEALGKKR